MDRWLTGSYSEGLRLLRNNPKGEDWHLFEARRSRTYSLRHRIC